MQFPRSNLYQIVCQDGNQALRLTNLEPGGAENSPVSAGHPDMNDMAQLWMVEKVGLDDDEFEIVNFQSTLVWDEEGGEIRLRRGKQAGDQLFKVERVNNNSFWFKTSSDSNRAAALEGVLRYKHFDPNHPNQLFFIVPVNNSNSLNQSCILTNNNSGKSLDVPGGTF